jgi:acetylornithine deacetylase/succinyl-diaminopimelate desuccinylase-like protein
MAAAAWERYLEEQRGRFLAELLDFLRIPSISALPEHTADVERAAQWVADRLGAAGMEGVRILPTGGHPVVYAEWLHAPGKPTIIVYGHFDTQPADPLHLWTSPPFEPVIRDERVYARGASDDKGNMLIPILAVEALLETEGTLPVNLKFLLEGQEEIGSPQLAGFLEEYRALLAGDLVVSADSGQWREDQPALALGSRGICALQIDVRGAKTDLHSGGHGGAAPNPIHALAHIVNSLRDADGRILVAGFYDDVVPLSDEDRAMIAAVPFDEEAYMRRLGVTALPGEPGYTVMERRWARPTLELNGIWGGFEGAGMKTVLPSEAHAKITCRLVSDQDPSTIPTLIAAHVRRHAPPGVTVEVQTFGSAAYPYHVPADHWGNQVIVGVLAELYGKEPLHLRTGGSVPACGLLLRTLGVYTVGFGFGLDDEQIHAPDEFFRLSNFHRGQAAYCMLLHRLGSEGVRGKG